jgi:putative flippase GtrA
MSTGKPSTFKSLFRYGVVSGMSFVINLGLTALLHEVFGVAEEAAYAVALITVFLTNFVMFRYYVYGRTVGAAHRQLLAYTLSAIGFRGGEYLSFLLVHTVLGVYYLAAIILVQSVSAITKFFYYRAVVFRAAPRSA